MNKRLEKELEIRMLLDEKKYHLNTTVTFDEFVGKTVDWKLFKKHDGWLTDGSKPIMSSETHTEEELLKFAKKHKEYKLVDFSKMFLIVPIFTLFIAIVNLFIDSEFMRGTILGLNIAVIFVCIIITFIINRNKEVLDLEFIEYFERICKGN